MNNVELKPSLWLYAIHSKNAELIHLLESNEVFPLEIANKDESGNINYIQCFIESIKCHHNDIANYIENNFLNQNYMNNSKTKEEILSNCIKYHNYSHFEIDAINEYGFFYLSYYNYCELFDLLYKKKEKEIKINLIQL